MMAGGGFGNDYYEELQARMRAIVIAVGYSIPPEQLPLLNELVDANEPGVALDILTEALADSGSQISQADFEDMKLLAEKMGLASAVIDRVRPLAGQ